MDSTNEPAFWKHGYPVKQGYYVDVSYYDGGDLCIEVASLARVQLILSLSDALFALFLSFALRLHNHISFAQIE